MNKKNIILIVIDALRPKNLGLFSSDIETDTNLKKISEDSILFKNNFSSSNSTAPAVTSMLTGRYPPKHGIMHQLPYTKPQEIQKFKESNSFWLPNFLRSNGYETIGIDWIGLWFKKGFDYYGEGEEDLERTKFQAPFRSAREITDLAIKKIMNANKPFFLFLHFWDTHFPFPHTKEETKDEIKDVEGMLSSIKNQYQREYLKKRISGKQIYSFRGIIEKYNLSIKNVDKQIGRIYDFLKLKRLWGNTILIILGDHGTNLMEHNIYFSSSGLYDESIHTPMILHLPGLGAKKIEKFVQEVDIAPTILDYLDLENDKRFDGKSLLPIITKDYEIRNKIFSFDGLCEDIRTIRTRYKKLIVAKNNFCNLCKGSHHGNIEEYDLEKDPEEKNNICSGENESEILEKFDY